MKRVKKLIGTPGKGGSKPATGAMKRVNKLTGKGPATSSAKGKGKGKSKGKGHGKGKGARPPSPSQSRPVPSVRPVPRAALAMRAPTGVLPGPGSVRPPAPGIRPPPSGVVVPPVRPPAAPLAVPPAPPPAAPAPFVSPYRPPGRVGPVCTYCSDTSDPPGHRRFECQGDPVCWDCLQKGPSGVDFDHDRLSCPWN